MTLLPARQPQSLARLFLAIAKPGTKLIDQFALLLR